MASAPRCLCDKKYSERTNLLRTHCDARSDAISRVAYRAELTLPKGRHYYGYMKAGFDIDVSKLKKPESNDPLHSLRIDFRGLDITEVKANGIVISEDVEFFDHAIFVPVKYLREECNTICVAYKNEYGSTGVGLHSYVDPQDDEQYVYTQFEAPFAHEVFPIFDQPNLKASFSLTLNVPEKWSMITNEPAGEVVSYQGMKALAEAVPHSVLAQGFDVAASVKRCVFLATPKLSTYLFALCGGNYDVIVGPADLVCPMKLYFRKSMAKYITQDYSDEWFKASDHATRFFASYMNVAYPYTKMDHIFVPEFNMGAMEHPGCITYTEGYLPKVPLSRSRRVGITNTIMHEIAHQWFGNLITMKWWDDLWLNEAFATFMSCVAQEGYTDAKGVHTGDEAWLYLIMDAFWGLREDQEQETHPIAVYTKDTIEAENIFDGISYGKGSAFLKTWCHYVSPETFREGVRDYFSRYMGGNASLSQFVKTQDVASPLEIEQWSRSWLETKGVMEVSGEASIDNGKISKYVINQSFCSNADKVYKSHRMDLILFYEDGEKLRKEVVTTIVEATAATEIEAMKGRLAPKAIIINGDYHVYCKALHDSASMDYLLSNYHKIALTLDRFVLLMGLYERIRDGTYPVLKFLKAVEVSLLREPVLMIRENLINKACEFIEYISEDHFDTYSEKLYRVIKAELVRTVNAGADRGIAANLSECATTLVAGMLGLMPKNRHLLESEGRSALRSKVLADVYPLEESHLRGILTAVVSLQTLKSEERAVLIEEILGPMGPSSDAEKCRRACKAATPDPAVKEEIYDLLIHPRKEISQEAYGDYASHFASRLNPELFAPYKEAYFDHVLRVHQENVIFISTKFLHNCLPSAIHRDDVTFAERLAEIGASSDADQLFKTHAAKVLDHDMRRVRAKKLTKPEDW